MRRAALTEIAWLTAAVIAINLIDGALGFIAWLACMSLYCISLFRGNNGKYRTPSTNSYHSDTRKDTETNSRTRTITRPITGAITYTFKALTGGTASASVVHDDFPILAVKRGNLSTDGHTIYIGSIGPKHLPFDCFDCDAECNLTVTNHKAPQWDCSCGFYAVPPDRIDDFKSFGDYIFEVELSGVVIETERGYRAQHQKIIGIYEDSPNWPWDRTQIKKIIKQQTGIDVKSRREYPYKN